MFELNGKLIPATLAELVDRKHTALLLWDMENAIAPNAFNYKEILGTLQMLAARARSVAVPVFYSVQTPFDLLKEEAGVWVRVRMKRSKAKDPGELLKETDDPKDARSSVSSNPSLEISCFKSAVPTVLSARTSISCCAATASGRY